MDDLRRSMKEKSFRAAKKRDIGQMIWHADRTGLAAKAHALLSTPPYYLKNDRREENEHDD